MSYSDKVQAILAPTSPASGRTSAPTTRFVLLEIPPLIVVVNGANHRIQIEQESVSIEWRLFAVNLEKEKTGSFSAWLLQTAGSKEAMEKRMFFDGLEFNQKQGGLGIFKQLVRDAHAKELPRN